MREAVDKGRCRNKQMRRKSQCNLDYVNLWLESYPKWKLKIDAIKSQIEHIPIFTQRQDVGGSQRQGVKNDNVINEVIKRLQLSEEELPYWELRVKVMEGGLALMSVEDRHFIDLKYFQRLTNDQLMERFHISTGILFRRRQRILLELYDAIGGSESILWIDLK